MAQLLLLLDRLFHNIYESADDKAPEQENVASKLEKTLAAYSGDHGKLGSVISRLEKEGLPYLEEKDLMSILEMHDYLNDDQYARKENVVKALDQAKKSHGNQTREVGGSYLTQHIYPVTRNSVEYGAQKNGKHPMPDWLPIVALLHDSVEDDPKVSLDYVQEMFGGELGTTVRYALDGLTKPNWRDFPGQSETKKREYVEEKMIEKVEEAERLMGSTELHYIKALDRINNVQCMPIPNDLEKTMRICKNTKMIFEPWLTERDPYLAEVLGRKREKAEDSALEMSLQNPYSVRLAA